MKAILFSFAVLISSMAFAQEEEVTEFTPATKKVTASNQDRIVLDFTFDNWKNDIDQLKTKWYSRGFGFAFMYDVRLKESKFSVAPGIGFTSNSVFFDALLVDTGKAAFDYAAYETRNIKKSKFNTVFLEIPLELRFRANPDNPAKSFKFAIGFKAGLRIDAKTKIKEEIGTQTKVFKDKRWEDAETFRAGPTVRMGYGPFNVIGFYSITNVFKKGEGPEVTPWSIGISLNGL
ncbi:MAG: PorT family protein [Chitinophagales bacterium]|nr:PorT family protein [Chitinophagales bacterium]